MSILRYGFPASNGRQTPDVVSTGRLTPDVNTLNSSMYEGTGVRSGAATPSSEEAIIAVMGSTGSGKTSFINLIADKSVEANHGLSSSNVEIHAVECTLEGGRRVRLIDMPGFDDTYVSDIDILDMIGTYLAVTYRSERLLTGVIYLHRITDNRIGGVSHKNIKLFHKLCGDRAQTHVILATSMWDLVSPSTGAAREQELKDVFWRHMIRVGATTARHDNTSEAARAIVSRLVDMNTTKLKIQREMVDEGKSLFQSTAGLFLFDEQRKLRVRYEREFAELEILRSVSGGTKSPSISPTRLRKGTMGSESASGSMVSVLGGALSPEPMSIEGRLQEDSQKSSEDVFLDRGPSKALTMASVSSVTSEEVDDLRKRVALLEVQMRGAGGVSDLFAGATGDLTTTVRKLLMRGEKENKS